MDTRLLALDAAGVEKAAQCLRAGQVVAIPTETVYGLAASALHAEAAQGIYVAKGRPLDNPMIVHIDDLAMLPLVVESFPSSAQKLADAFWPGPLTMVLPKSARIPAVVSAGLGTVGVRMPAHPGARAIIRSAGLPLAAPSANLSGRPSPTTAAHVMQDMAGRIPLVLDGGACPVGVESTVLSLAGSTPVVLRPGFVTAEEIAEVLGCEVAVAPTQEVVGTPASPGMKYRHYAPQAELAIINADFEKYAEYIRKNKEKIPGLFALCFEGEAERLPVPALTYGAAEDAASQAAQLYGALRELDARGAKTVFARMPAQAGAGQAVYNRLLRAASFRIINL